MAPSLPSKVKSSPSLPDKSTPAHMTPAPAPAPEFKLNPQSVLDQLALNPLVAEKILKLFSNFGEDAIRLRQFVCAYVAKQKAALKAASSPFASRNMSYIANLETAGQKLWESVATPQEFLQVIIRM